MVAIAKHFGVCRYVYNHFLEKRNQVYRSTGVGSTYNRDCEALVLLKKEFPWIGEVNSQSLQQELRGLNAAFSNFFKGNAKFPRFHSKHNDKQSFRVPQRVRVENGRIYINKFKGGIRLKQHRPIEGEIKHATIVQNRSGQYFACICVEREMSKLPPSPNVVGVDLGVKNLATCSNGIVFPNIKPYANLQQRLRRLQKSLSRKVKGSHNYTRAKKLVARCHQRIADIRSNHLHHVSKALIDENQVVVLEDLNVQGMLKNRRLAKSISDVSLGELIRQIEYKAGWYGREVVKVDRWYPSSKTCNACGYVNADLTLTEREWACPLCGTDLDRDRNASLNILGEGLRIRARTAGTAGIACGEDVRPPQGGCSL
jgi:putative transposase